MNVSRHSTRGILGGMGTEEGPVTAQTTLLQIHRGYCESFENKSVNEGQAQPEQQRLTSVTCSTCPGRVPLERKLCKSFRASYLQVPSYRARVVRDRAVEASRKLEDVGRPPHALSTNSSSVTAHSISEACEEDPKLQKAFLEVCLTIEQSPYIPDSLP